MLIEIDDKTGCAKSGAWKLVPIEPIPVMLDRFIDAAVKENWAGDGLEIGHPDIGYTDMLRCAPPPPAYLEYRADVEAVARAMKAALVRMNVWLRQEDELTCQLIDGEVELLGLARAALRAAGIKVEGSSNE